MPAYADYQYSQRNWNIRYKIDLDYSIKDANNNSFVSDKRFFAEGSKQIKEIEGAHPDDKSNIKNIAMPKNANEVILELFRKEQFEVLSNEIVAFIKDLNNFKANKCMKQGFYEQAREYIMANNLINNSLIIYDKRAEQLIEKNIGSLEQTIYALFEDDKYISNKSLDEVLGNISLDTILENFLDRKYKSSKLASKVLKRTDAYELGEVVSENVYLAKGSAPSVLKPIRTISKAIVEVPKIAVEVPVSILTIIGNKIRKIVGLGGQEGKENVANKNKWINEVMKSVVKIETIYGSGSGFIVKHNGYILTNSHVINKANDIKVVLDSGKAYYATVVNNNESKDIALIKIDGEEFLALKLGSVYNLNVGDSVIAIGAPSGLSQSVTKGIVSAIRKIKSDKNQFVELTYIQTDAAINPGNSGGPLFDMEGYVVGINTQKIVSVDIEGLNFSLAINEAEELLSKSMY